MADHAPPIAPQGTLASVQELAFLAGMFALAMLFATRPWLTAFGFFAIFLVWKNYFRK